MIEFNGDVATITGKSGLHNAVTQAAIGKILSKPLIEYLDMAIPFHEVNDDAIKSAFARLAKGDLELIHKDGVFTFGKHQLTGADLVALRAITDAALNYAADLLKEKDFVYKGDIKVLDWCMDFVADMEAHANKYGYEQPLIASNQNEAPAPKKKQVQFDSSRNETKYYTPARDTLKRTNSTSSMRPPRGSH